MARKRDLHAAPASSPRSSSKQCLTLSRKREDRFGALPETAGLFCCHKRDFDHVFPHRRKFHDPISCFFMNSLWTHVANRLCGRCLP